MFFSIRDQPECHLVKLGTMGEYGTPNIDIEEGYRDHPQRAQRHAAVSQAAGLVLSPVEGSRLAQYPVHLQNLGHPRDRPEPGRRVRSRDRRDDARRSGWSTRFDYDGIWGTVLNRFCIEAAIGHPLTVHGKGGQTRGYLNIRDTMRCIEIAIEKPAKPGEYRVFNQFTEQFSVAQLAELIQAAAKHKGRSVEIQHIADPRVEAEVHYYNARNTKLLDLGLTPHLLSKSLLDSLMNIAIRYRETVDASLMRPRVDWRQASNPRISSAVSQTVAADERT